MNRRRMSAVARGLAISCLLSGTAFGQSTAGTYRVLHEHSAVGFSIIKWMVFRETGRFTRFTGTVRYDPRTPTESSVDFDVIADSLDTGIATRDSVLRSDDFFDVARFPVLSFRSVAVRTEKPAVLSVTGDLTIRDVTQRITIPVVVLGASLVQGVGAIGGFESRFTIDRTAFGVNGSRWSGGRLSLGHEVDIELRIAAQAQTVMR